MWDVEGLRCSVCEMLGMWDAQDVGCLGCRMFRMGDIRDAVVGYLAGYGMLIYKMPPGGFYFAFDTVRSLDALKRTFK